MPVTKAAVLAVQKSPQASRKCRICGLRNRSLLVALLVTVLPAMTCVAKQDDGGLAAPNAELVKLSDDFAFTEGPANDADGNIFFTDQPNDRIMKWNAKEDTIEEWMKPAGRSNGMWFDQDGNLLTCADGENQLWSISPDRQVTVLCDNFESSRFNGPNDLWVDGSGRVYFTDPLYVRSYWERDAESELDGEHVYRFDPSTGEVKRVATGFVRPNGIIGTPDGTRLYVADIGDRKTYQFEMDEQGDLGTRTLFCEQGSDGMTLDQQGNVYLTGRGVTIFNPAGERIDQIEIPEGWTANVTFGGVYQDILFITASRSVYRLQMSVKGAFTGDRSTEE